MQGGPPRRLHTRGNTEHKFRQIVLYTVNYLVVVPYDTRIVFDTRHLRCKSISCHVIITGELKNFSIRATARAESASQLYAAYVHSD